MIFWDPKTSIQTDLDYAISEEKEKDWLGPNWEAVAPFLVASPGKKGAWKKVPLKDLHIVKYR